MRTLADAWNWYEATKKCLWGMKRLGEKHWDHPSLADASIWQDDFFRQLEATKILEETIISLQPIEDLAVLVMFSVFERRVRDYLTGLIKPQADQVTDPILKAAADDAMQGVAEGSFYRRVLEPLKNQGRVSASLVTQVDQVRDYRNWVAHGRDLPPANNVTPQMAYDRLSEFLAALGISAEREQEQLDWFNGSK
jgi:hypothetical protein